MPDTRKLSDIPEIQSLSTKRAYSIEIYSFSSGPFYKDDKTTISTLKFPAFIKDYTDSYKSNWAPQDIYGKMDPIVTFKNTTRSIALSFDIPNDSYENAQFNLAQINHLIRGLYPVYDEGLKGTAILSSPPMFRVRFANLIKNAANDDDGTENSLKSGLLCYFSGFDFKPSVDSGFFSDNEEKLFPKLIAVSLTLNVIHEHPLGNKKSEKDGAPPEPRVSFDNFPHNTTDKNPVDTKNIISSTSTVSQPQNQQQQAQQGYLIRKVLS